MEIKNFFKYAILGVASALVVGSSIIELNKSKAYSLESKEKVNFVSDYFSMVNKPICSEKQKSFSDDCNSIEGVKHFREFGGLEKNTINWSESEWNRGCKFSNLLQNVKNYLEEPTEFTDCAKSFVKFYDPEYFGAYNEFYKGYRAALKNFRENSDLREGYFQFGREYFFIFKELEENIEKAKKPRVFPFLAGLSFFSLLGIYGLIQNKKNLID